MKKLYICLLCLLAASLCHAQWDGNAATVNNPVSTSSADESYARVASDGAGGVIAVWATPYNGGNQRSVYAQRKTSAGIVRWGGADQPVLLFTTATDVYDLAVADVKPDGNGGVYISWEQTTDDTTSGLYLQHLNSQGNTTFAPGGIPISPIRGNYAFGGKLCVDNAGVIICWSEQVQDADSVLPSYAQVVVQRFNTAGTAQWGDGVPVSTVPALRAIAEIISDGNNGALVSFVDARNSQFDVDGNSDNLDIYAQHISSNGTRLWGAQDAVVSTAPNNQLPLEGGGAAVFSSLISDGAGGLILVYEDYRSGNDSAAQLYAQRLNAAGTRLWAVDGVALYATVHDNDINLQQVVGDGANGMVACWTSPAMGNVGNAGAIVVQRIDASGTRAWSSDGLVVGDLGIGSAGSLLATAEGLFTVAWIEGTNSVVKAQLLNTAGQIQWVEGGVPICTNPASAPVNPILTRSDGNNMIVVWTDQRNYATSLSDLYAAKFNAGGGLVSTVLYKSIANGNWNNPATWQGAVVPPPGADVLVVHAVVVTADAACNSLTVQTPGSIRVNSGVRFTVLH